MTVHEVAEWYKSEYSIKTLMEFNKHILAGCDGHLNISAFGGVNFMASTGVATVPRNLAVVNKALPRGRPLSVTYSEVMAIIFPRTPTAKLLKHVRGLNGTMD